MSSQWDRRQSLEWRDILLGRAQSGGAAAIQLMLIVVWHWTVFAGTLVAVDWLLGYGASSGGVPVRPAAFDWFRALEYVLHPVAATSLLTLLLLEALISWLTFRAVLYRLPLSFSLCARSWWRICLWGVPTLPVVSLLFAESSKNYDAAMNLPLLWVPCAVVGTTLLARLEAHQRRRRREQGACVHCGYNLTGNVSGRCPECGEPIG